MYKITGKNTFEVAPDTNPAEGLLDGTYYNLDIEKMDGRTWHILKDHKSYYVQWVERSEDGKTFALKINGQLLELNAKDHYDLLLEQMGMSAANTAKATKLKAPMLRLLSFIREVDVNTLSAKAVLPIVLSIIRTIPLATTV